MDEKSNKGGSPLKNSGTLSMQDFSPKGGTGRNVTINLQPLHQNTFSKSASSNFLLPPSTRRHSTQSENHDKGTAMDPPQILVIEELKQSDTFRLP